jgi:hypothetical protein
MTFFSSRRETLACALLFVASIALAAMGGASGVAWAGPTLWKEQAPRQMRAATYTVPAAPGDAEAGECAVYYFGKGQGGDADANIARWVGQFEGGTKPVRTTKSVAGMTISIVEISGTYLAPSGPMMQSQGKKPGFTLVAAVVPAPEGSIFFKLTGPSKTVAAARADFDAMIASIKKRPGKKAWF